MGKRKIVIALLMSLFLTACGPVSGTETRMATRTEGRDRAEWWEYTAEHGPETEENAGDMIVPIDFGDQTCTYKVAMCSCPGDTVKITVEIVKKEIARLNENLHRYWVDHKSSGRHK